MYTQNDSVIYTYTYIHKMTQLYMCTYIYTHKMIQLCIRTLYIFTNDSVMHTYTIHKMT